MLQGYEQIERVEMWTEIGTVLIGNFNDQENKDLKNEQPIASFDLDGTIINCKGKNVFPKHEQDWKYTYLNVKTTLQAVCKTHQIVIFTNQNWGSKIEKIQLFKRRFEHVAKDLNIPITLFAALDNNKFRKPQTGMFELFLQQMHIDKKHSFYVGDAAGRKNDYNDTDRTFAINLNLTFHTPEEYFLHKPKELFKLKCDLLNVPTRLPDYQIIPLN